MEYVCHLVFSIPWRQSCSSSLDSIDPSLTIVLFAHRCRFESLENLVFADRDTWDAVLAKTSMNQAQLYKFLILVHNNKNGSNDAAIDTFIKENTYNHDHTVAQRAWLNAFDRLSSTNKENLIAAITNTYDVSHYDSKTDNSSSYATTDFVHRTLEQSRTYVHKFSFFFFLSARSNGLSFSPFPAPFLASPSLEPRSNSAVCT